MSLDSTMSGQENQPVKPDDFFTQVPNTLRGDNRIDGNAKIMAGMIASLAKEEGYCWSTNAWFAEQFNVSESTILRWLKQLEKFGYVRVMLKEKTRRGTDRLIYLQDYPKLVRDSTPQSVGEAIMRSAITQSKGDKRARGSTSATPPPATVLPLPPQVCYPRGVNSATQLDTVLDSEKEKRKETLISPLPPAGGTPPAAAAHSEISLALFQEQKAPDKTPWTALTEEERRPYIDQATKELMIIHLGSGITPKPKLIEVRAKNIYDISVKEIEATI